MFKHSRFVFLSVTLLFVLMVSLARPMAAYADDSTPPPTATEEPAAPPTEEAPAEVPSDSSSSDTLTVSSTEAEPAAVSEILEAAPEGTEVVVLDENSEALPLTSEEAAAIVATADPIWCPAGTLPGGTGCTTNFASPQALIDDMDAANPGTTNSIYEQAGIIYFTANPGGAFVLTPGGGAALTTADYNALKGFNLTLQGGWNGVSGAGAVIGGQTDFGANRIQIGSCSSTSCNPWAGNITINNISIDGVVNSAGLIVYTVGTINLNSVNSQNNTGSSGIQGDGAYLNNSITNIFPGLTGSGDVNVNSSSFNNNTQNGLRVVSNGNITFSRVTANNNTKRGTQLDSTLGSGNISISSSTFNLNGTGGSYRGIDAHSNGNMTLANVIASGNTSDGALLDNTSGSGSVSVNSSTFNGNGKRGLDVLSNGDITLFDVIANENIRSGVRLDNCYVVNSVCTGTGIGSVTIDGALLSGNGVDGLDVYSNSDITVDNITASFNAEIGASLVNDTGEGNISVSNSTFNSNTSVQGLGQNMGLEAISNGDITVDMVVANDNTGTYGAFLSGGSLSVANSIFNNNKSGLYLEGDDAEVVCSQANNNATYGIDGLNLSVFTLDDVTFSGNGTDYRGSPSITSGGCTPDEGGGDEGGGDEGGGDEGIEPEGEVSESSSSSPDIIPITGLPLHIVHVIGSEQIELDCGAFSGTKLILPNGDNVVLPCPIHDQGLLTGHTQDELPGMLDDQFGFLSALDAEVMRGGHAVAVLDTNMLVSFIVPDGQHDANLVILHWDATQSQWVQVPGGHFTDDGYFETSTQLTGMFVLVTNL